MSFANAHFALYNNVKVDIIGESHFANHALVQAKNARDPPGYLSNLRFQSRVRGDVTKLKNRRPQLLPSAVKNYQRGTKQR
jgi:hypothetical protein